MDGHFGLQLAMELARVFPVQEIVHTGVKSIIQLARDVRASGSNIFVEEDLADIFGRGHVSAELGIDFKKAVHVQKITPLYQGSEVELHAGAGPTVSRALQDSRYFATIITLSMFSYFHGRQGLANLIHWTINKRFEAKVVNSQRSPGADVVAQTLQACSSQSSAFHWAPFRQRIKDAIRAILPDYVYNSAYCCIPPHLFLALTDFLYITQRLPADRRVIIPGEKGFIVVVIWAHFILRLSVVISGLPLGDLVFGNVEEPNVFIQWTSKALEELEDDVSGGLSGIRPLDGDAVIVMTCEPDDDERTLPKLRSPAERHPLAEYGLVALRRSFNTTVILSDEDSIYASAVDRITGLAAHASQRLRRQSRYLGVIPGIPIHSTSDPGGTHQYAGPELWRITTASDILYNETAPRKIKVAAYHDFLAGRADLPENNGRAFGILDDDFIEHGRERGVAEMQLESIVIDLADLVITVAHIDNIAVCVEMPALLEWKPAPFVTIPDNASVDVVVQGRNHNVAIRGTKVIKPEAILDDIMDLLVDDSDLKRERLKSVSMPLKLENVQGYSLVSEYGWSVFLSSIGAKDPADVRPELVHVARGTPINARTGERRYRIRDAPHGLFPYGIVPTKVNLTNDNAIHLPRSAASLKSRSEYWSTMRDEFEFLLHLEFTASNKWRPAGADRAMTSTLGYRLMHECIWRSHLTPSCPHGGFTLLAAQGEDCALDRDSDCEWSRGWPEKWNRDRIRQKMVVILSSDQPEYRWTQLMAVVGDDNANTMLRTKHCCEACALDHVRSMQGNWYLLL